MNGPLSPKIYFVASDFILFLPPSNLVSRESWLLYCFSQRNLTEYLALYKLGFFLTQYS